MKRSLKIVGGVLCLAFFPVVIYTMYFLGMIALNAKTRQEQNGAILVLPLIIVCGAMCVGLGVSLLADSRNKERDD